MLPDTSKVYVSTTGGTPQIELTLDGNTEVVSSLLINGALQPAGLYTATSAPTGATADESFFSGNGTLQVLPEPGKAGIAVLLGCALFSRRRGRKIDYSS